MPLPNRMHPDVVTEYERRVADNPDICWYPCGNVHRTASNPSPKWCVKRVGHSGNHSDVEREKRERERHARNQAAYRERQKLKLKSELGSGLCLALMSSRGVQGILPWWRLVVSA